MGAAVGISVGKTGTCVVVEVVGTGVGQDEGAAVGAGDGVAVGLDDGAAVGAAVGASVGKTGAGRPGHAEPSFWFVS